MGNMRFKVGDRVKIKSLDWYNENKDEYGNIDINHNFTFYPDRSKYCGKVFTISEVFDYGYTVKEDNYEYYWTDEMIECKVESIEDRMKELRKMCTISLSDSKYSDKVEVLLNDYEYIEENGKSYFVRKKREYPKTYKECREILKVGKEHTLEGEILRNNDYKIELLVSFQKLLMCRDAYWKIAGEEMGLGKPWEPDYDSGVNKYGIICMNGVVQESNPTTNWERHLNKILDFPTKEMRAAFYENFKGLIEQCKEFL